MSYGFATDDIAGAKERVAWIRRQLHPRGLNFEQSLLRYLDGTNTHSELEYLLESTVYVRTSYPVSRVVMQRIEHGVYQHNVRAIFLKALLVYRQYRDLSRPLMRRAIKAGLLDACYSVCMYVDGDLAWPSLSDNAMIDRISDEYADQNIPVWQLRRYWLQRRHYTNTEFEVVLLKRVFAEHYSYFDGIAHRISYLLRKNPRVLIPLGVWEPRRDVHVWVPTNMRRQVFAVLLLCKRWRLPRYVALHIAAFVVTE